MYKCQKQKCMTIFEAVTDPFARIYLGKNTALEGIAETVGTFFLNEDIKYLIRKGYLTGEKVDYIKGYPDFIGQEYGNLEMTPDGMNYWEEIENQGDFLHSTLFYKIKDILKGLVIKEFVYFILDICNRYNWCHCTYHTIMPL